MNKEHDGDPYEVLKDHDEMSEDESVGALEGSDPDPEALEDELDLDEIVNNDEEDDDD